jgi:hypothetical protein
MFFLLSTVCGLRASLDFSPKSPQRHSHIHNVSKERNTTYLHVLDDSTNCAARAVVFARRISVAEQRLGSSGSSYGRCLQSRILRHVKKPILSFTHLSDAAVLHLTTFWIDLRGLARLE